MNIKETKDFDDNDNTSFLSLSLINPIIVDYVLIVSNNAISPSWSSYAQQSTACTLRYAPIEITDQNLQSQVT